MNKQSNNKVTKEEQIKFLVDNGYEPQDCTMSGTLLGCVGLTLLDYLDNTYYEISKEEIQNYINQQKQQSTKEEQVQNDNTTNTAIPVSVEIQPKSWYELGQRPPVGETVILCRKSYRDIPVKIKAFSDTIFIYAPTEGMDIGTEFSSYIEGCSFKHLPVKTKDEQTIDEISDYLTKTVSRNFDFSKVATEIFNKFIKAHKD